jgi:hypothetical protein
MSDFDSHLLAGDRYLTVFGAHRITGYSRRMLRHLITTGELPALRNGKRTWKVKQSDLFRCLLHRIWRARVRNQAVISTFFACSAESGCQLTIMPNSTIYSTGSETFLRNTRRAKTTYNKGETYDKNQKSTEVHQ